MKITDFSLIFVGVMLPIIIIVYVNVSFNIKAQEQEMYYQKIINSAIEDAANQMKEVENIDPGIDYGYSGTSDKKVSVNASLGVETFLNSLYNNFGIKGNDAAERYLQLFIPAVAVIDYNGIQISSVENTVENGNNVTKHTLKPKRYYSYSYSILNNGTIVEGIDKAANSIHTIEFTMDDYITHRGAYKYLGTFTDIPVKSFYIGDTANNKDLVGGTIGNLSEVVDLLKQKRKEIISKVVTEEMAYAVNSNNSYAKAAGISYNFVFPTTTQDEMYETIENIGIIAFVQGISIGNKYLNTKAYGVSKLDLATRFYFSVPSSDSKVNTNLYHKDTLCPEYIVSNHTKITPYFVITKQQAASTRAAININGQTKKIVGFYPCPICRP